jgi:Cft2 family RNA processing exonuclease
MRFTNLTQRTEIGANCYLLEIAGRRIVLDCGLHPEKEGDEALPRLDLLWDGLIDTIILSHAHHDHVGSLPVLMRRQERAPVLMPEPTRLLSDVMLHNSVNVMTKQREELNIANYPLFTHGEVDRCAKRWRGCPYKQRLSLEGERLSDHEDAELSIEFHDAGHILGSAGALFRADDRVIFYTGDVNFSDQSIARAAAFPEEHIDVLIIETTRGDHPLPLGFSRQAEEDRFARALNDALSHGAVLIPVFALGKTQEILATLHHLRQRGKISSVPIYIGGLSTKLCGIYDKLAHAVRRQKPNLQLIENIAPFVIAGRDPDDAPLKKGRIFALSAGMMTEKTLSNSIGRRILSDPDQSIFFVGYADPRSPAGRVRAANQGDTITLDADFPAQVLRCRTEEFNFSAHASRESIREYIQRLAPGTVILVHGDPPAVTWFEHTLKSDLPKSKIVVPQPGQTLEI